MNEEMDTLCENGTWDFVPFPASKNPIKVKHNNDGSVSKYKARLVAKGYVQMYGKDYEETFNVVSMMTTIRATIEVVAIKGWTLH